MYLNDPVHKKVISVVLAALLIASSLAITNPVKAVNVDPSSGSAKDPSAKPCGSLLTKKVPSGNNVYAVCVKVRDVLFSVSKDNGNTFSKLRNLSNTHTAHYPKLNVSDDKVYVVWESNNQIFLKVIYEQGDSLGGVFNLSNSTSRSRLPQMVVSDNNVSVTWTEIHEGMKKQKFAKLTPDVRGVNFERFKLEKSGDPEYMVNLGLPQWVCGSTGSNCSGIKISGLGTDTVTIQSGLGTTVSTGVVTPANNPTGHVLFNNSTNTSTNPVDETWILKDDPNTVGTTLSSTVVTQSGDNANVTLTFSTNPNIGNLIVQYVIREGQSLKHNVTLSPVTGFAGSLTAIQHWRFMANKVVAYGLNKTMTAMVDQCTAQTSCTMDSTQLDNATLQFYKDTTFVVAESLEPALSKFKSFTLQKSQGGVMDVNFTYDFSSFSIDPNALSNQPYKADGYVSTSLSTGATSCPGTTSSATLSVNPPTALTNFYVRVPISSSYTCILGFIKWDISGITYSNTSTSFNITNTKMTYTVSSTVNNNRSCNYTAMHLDVQANSGSDVYNDVNDYSPESAVFLSGDSSCETAGTHTIDFGTTTSTSTPVANADIYRKLADWSTKWFETGIRLDKDRIDGIQHLVPITADGSTNYPTLTVTYIP